jgi:hypothetical protein
MGAPCIFPACINRMFGRDPTQSRRVPSLPDVLVTLSARAGKPLWIPSDVGGLCCATPWGSKGYRKGHDYMAVSMADALWRWSDGGRLPIVVDAASCTLGLVEDVRLHLDEQRRSLHERLKIIDSITWCRDLLPRLKIQRKLGRVVLHPTCSMNHLALATLPPWHYSSDCIAIEYWTDPAAIAALLLPGVAPDGKSGGRAFLRFLDWQFTASDDELTDPARFQYREAFALVEAIFEGTPINYCPFIFVDNDAAIARGWAQGFPKKLGSVYQTRSFSAPSPPAAPLAKGSRFGASVAAHGERLATARIQLEKPIVDPSTIFIRPTVMRRYFPQLAVAGQPKPPANELTMSLTDNLAIVDVWAGSAELRMPEVQGEEMHLIAPLRVGRGYRLGMAYSVTDLRIVKNYAV